MYSGASCLMMSSHSQSSAALLMLHASGSSRIVALDPGLEVIRRRARRPNGGHVLVIFLSSLCPAQSTVAADRRLQHRFVYGAQLELCLNHSPTRRSRFPLPVCIKASRFAFWRATRQRRFRALACRQLAKLPGTYGLGNDLATLGWRSSPAGSLSSFDHSGLTARTPNQKIVSKDAGRVSRLNLRQFKTSPPRLADVALRSGGADKLTRLASDD